LNTTLVLQTRSYYERRKDGKAKDGVRWRAKRVQMTGFEGKAEKGGKKRQSHNTLVMPIYEWDEVDNKSTGPAARGNGEAETAIPRQRFGIGGWNKGGGGLPHYNEEAASERTREEGVKRKDAMTDRGKYRSKVSGNGGRAKRMGPSLGNKKRTSRVRKQSKSPYEEFKFEGKGN